MKIFKIMMMALVAMCGLNSCSDDCNHDFIEHDYSKELVGTWTCMEPENEFAEALVIKADGSVEVTGVAIDGLYETKGTIQVKNNKMIYKLDNGDEWEGRFEMIAGESFTMILDEELDVRYTYRYCENDLADELIGLWVCNDGLTDGITIMSYSDNGKYTITTATALGSNNPLLNLESDYVVVGDLVFTKIPSANVVYTAARMVYTPNGTSVGDIMTHQKFIPTGSGLNEYVMPFLRVKEGLNLTGKTYDYNSAYVTNAKGTDEDFTITGSTFNMANINAGNFDMMFRSVLYCVDFKADSIKQHFRVNGVETGFDTPITVEGNKVTLEMSAGNPSFRDVEMYMFQDQDDCQLHMYMHTDAFINYFANLELVTLLTEGKIDPTDAAAVEKVFTDMEARKHALKVSM